MADPGESHPTDAIKAPADQPLVKPAQGGQGPGPTPGGDRGSDAELEAHRAGRRALDEQLANARKPPVDDQVRGAGLARPGQPGAPGPLGTEMKQAGLASTEGPTPTPGAPVPPATDLNIQNGGR